MIYYKITPSGEVFSDCRIIELDGMTVSNPSAEQIAAAGWLPYTPPAPPAPEPPAPQDEPSYSDLIAAVKRQLEHSIEDLSDEDALAIAALYPTWKEALDAGKMVQAGERRWDDGKLWKCKQPHVPQSDWRPEATPALWYEVSVVPWPAWRKPKDATEAYPLNAQVSHIGKHWISKHPSNVWEPGTTGTETLWVEPD